MTVSAAVRFMPSPPARVLRRKRRGASGASPLSWNTLIDSRRSSGDELPSILQSGHPLYSVAQSYINQYDDYYFFYTLNLEISAHLDNIKHSRELAED